jgi:sodium-dependent phosphate transporter
MFLWIAVCGIGVSFLASCGIGANDVANSFATSVGSKTLTYTQAICMASVCEFLGAILMGSRVTETIRKGIADIDYYVDSPEILMYGMLCVLVSVTFWLFTASRLGMPVSTTHSTIGSIIGMSMVAKGSKSIVWGSEISDEFPYLTGVSKIVASWVVSPLLSAFFATTMFQLLRMTKVFQSYNKALFMFPIITGMTMFINTFFVISKGSELSDRYDDIDRVVISLCIGVFSCLLSAAAIPLIKKRTKDIEGVFSVSQVFSAMCDSFAHGANDVANSIGPFAAIWSIYENDMIQNKSEVPMWIFVIGGVGIVVGLAAYGHIIIKEIGVKLTNITASRGMCIELGAASVVILGTKYSIPLSTTHCQFGATTGVGLLDGVDNVDWKVIRKTLFGWIATLIVTGSVAATLTAQGIYSPYVNC